MLQSVLGIARQWSLQKFANFDPKLVTFTKLITFTLSNCKLTRKKKKNSRYFNRMKIKKKMGLICLAYRLQLNYQCDDHVFI